MATTTINFASNIKQLMEPWQSNSARPPFTEEQLVVMALVMTGSPQTLKQLFHWMLDNFFYYRLLARNLLWNSFDGYDRSPNESLLETQAKQFRRRLEEVVWRYERPFVALRGGDHPAYTISTSKAQDTLRSIIRPVAGLEHPQKHSFFDLRAELRNSVYENLFQYPHSGIFVVRPSQPNFRRIPVQGFPMLVQSRSTRDEFIRGKWHNVQWESDEVDEILRVPQNNGLLHTLPVKDILQPLLANRQFFEEAMPLFYSNNRFHFPYLEAMTRALKSLLPSRRCQMTHVSFEFKVKHREKYLEALEVWRELGCWCVPEAEEAFDLLAQMDGLRKLEICFDDANVHSNPDLRELYQVGTRKLLGLRGLKEVCFHGDCPSMEAALRPILTSTTSCASEETSEVDENHTQSLRPRKRRLLEASAYCDGGKAFT